MYLETPAKRLLLFCAQSTHSSVILTLMSLFFAIILSPGRHACRIDRSMLAHRRTRHSIRFYHRHAEAAQLAQTEHMYGPALSLSEGTAMPSATDLCLPLPNRHRRAPYPINTGPCLLLIPGLTGTAWLASSDQSKRSAPVSCLLSLTSAAFFGSEKQQAHHKIVHPASAVVLASVSQGVAKPIGPHPLPASWQ